MQIWEDSNECVSTPLGDSLHEPGEDTFVLALLVPKVTPSKNFSIRSALEGVGMTVDMVPNAIKHSKFEQYELVAIQSCLETLSARLQLFRVVPEFNLFTPARAITEIYGYEAAMKRCRKNAFINTREAKRGGWTAESQECYRKAFASAGLESQFYKEILGQHSEGADAHALEQSDDDDGLSMKAIKARQTDQAMAQSQRTGPPQVGKVEEDRACGEDDIKKLMSFLDLSIKYGERLKLYWLTMSAFHESEERSKYSNIIDNVIGQDFSNLTNDFYKLEINFRGVDKQGQKGGMGEENM